MKSNIILAVEKWHKLVTSKDDKILNDLLHDDVVFHSPVVFTPQHGKYITFLYLKAANEVLNQGTFTYIKEVLDDHTAVLEFETTIDGITLNGVDIITFNDQGKIIEFKVMVRPLKAVHKIHEKMGEMLSKMSPK